MTRSFREETITDMLMAALAAAGSPLVVVDFPDEPTTGADMEWHFLDEYHNRYFGLLIQAKRLYGKGKYWRRLSYKKLIYTPRGSSSLQSDTLIKAAAAAPNTYPIYAFYNPKRACDLFAAGNPSDQLRGVALADGRQVAASIKLAKSRKQRMTCLVSSDHR